MSTRPPVDLDLDELLPPVLIVRHRGVEYEVAGDMEIEDTIRALQAQAKVRQAAEEGIDATPAIRERFAIYAEVVKKAILEANPEQTIPTLRFQAMEAWVELILRGEPGEGVERAVLGTLEQVAGAGTEDGQVTTLPPTPRPRQDAVLEPIQQQPASP